MREKMETKRYSNIKNSMTSKSMIGKIKKKKQKKKKGQIRPGIANGRKKSRKRGGRVEELPDKGRTTET